MNISIVRRPWLAVPAVVLALAGGGVVASGATAETPDPGDRATSRAVEPNVMPCPKGTRPSFAGGGTACYSGGRGKGRKRVSCFQKTSEAISRVDDNNDIAIRATLVTKWCGTKRRIVSSDAFPDFRTSNGIKMEGDPKRRSVKLGKNGRRVSLRYRFIGSVDEDISANATVGPVSAGAGRATKGTVLDTYVTVTVDYRSTGVAYATCSGGITACQFTPKN